MPTYLRGVDVVDVTAGAVLVDHDVVVEGDSIESAWPAASAGRAPEGVARPFLCPGLIDTHAHFFLDCGGDPRASFLAADEQARWQTAAHNARTALEAGITTVRDCAAPTPAIFELRRQVDGGTIPGPHIQTAGLALMRPEGHCHWLGGVEVATRDQVRTAAERQLRDGADYIKLMASGGGLTPGTRPHEADLPGELIAEAVAVARDNDTYVTAHCHATESIERGLDAGLHMIEHASFVEAPGRYVYREELARRIADSGTVVGPTVFCALQTLHRLESGGGGNSDDVAVRERLRGRMTNVGHFHRLGVRLAGGTDCGVTDTPFDSLIDELGTYVAAGMTATEALRTVTVAAAEYLRLGRVGVVAAGARADLLLLSGNPLEDIGHLRHPIAVIKAGQLVSGSLPARS